MSRLEKMTFEQFTNSLEHREKEIYVPSLNGSINKVACMDNGVLDHSQVRQCINNAYTIYLSK